MALVLYRERQFLETQNISIVRCGMYTVQFCAIVGIGWGRARVFEEQDDKQIVSPIDGAGIPGMAAAADTPPVLTPQIPLLHPEMALPSVVQNTVRDTWGWLWKDTAGRVAPFFAASVAYAWWRSKHDESGRSIFPHGSWLPDALAGVALGIPLAGVAAVYREWTGAYYRLPTPADQVVQSGYYFFLNAPAEELFWRATVQDATVRALGRVPGVKRHHVLVGWALVTTAFGLYHRLGGWNWRSIVGVTAVGALLGGLYQWRRSVIMPTIMHGFATAGFLSWADVYMHRRMLRRYRQHLRGR
jgi:uncharacterized protein